MKSKQEFVEFVESVEAGANYQRPLGFSLGLRRRRGEKTLDVYFPHVNWQANFGSAAVFWSILGLQKAENGCHSLSAAQLEKALGMFDPYINDGGSHPNLDLLKQLKYCLTGTDASTYSQKDAVIFFLYDGSKAVGSAEEGYFKLQAMSQRCVKPHAVCMDGVFGALNNLAWTNYGPMLPEDVASERLQSMFREVPLQVSHVDKFPYLVDYTIPLGVRVTTAHRARLGAYLGEGTTIMPAGYVNFNAGTDGNVMVEGRISAGVFVGKNSDIGGGASIMGTLSGGNKDVLSIGEKCLLGANAGAGISLGFGSTIAAGLYVYAGMPIYMLNDKNQPVDLEGNLVEDGQNVVKAKALSGKEKLLFIQDSRTGRVICKPNPKTIELNPELHKDN